MLTEANGLVENALEEFPAKEGLPFAQDRAFVIASSHHLATTTAMVILPPATAADFGRGLGVDYWPSHQISCRKQYPAVHNKKAQGFQSPVGQIQTHCPQGLAQTVCSWHYAHGHVWMRAPCYEL